jgi:hypothetical protein
VRLAKGGRGRQRAADKIPNPHLSRTAFHMSGLTQSRLPILVRRQQAILSLLFCPRRRCRSWQRLLRPG